MSWKNCVQYVFLTNKFLFSIFTIFCSIFTKKMFANNLDRFTWDFSVDIIFHIKISKFVSLDNLFLKI